MTLSEKIRIMKSCQVTGAPVADVKIVLSMIAGNEERVIERCLESVKPHVDAMVVSVNGRDRTEEICKAAGAHVVREPWRDFGHNRTRAAQAARRHALRELRFDGNKTYLLLVDADMVFKVDDPQWKARLEFPAYRIDQHQGAFHHENLRLIRLDHDWRCVKRTHEFWAPFPDVFPLKFDGVHIDDWNDGGEHGRKYERDVEMLSADLDENPGDARSLFYLGETFYHWAQAAEEDFARKNPEAVKAGKYSFLAADRFRRAAEFYDLRWAAGDWDEERWFARYKQGLAELKLTALTKKIGPGIELLLEAYSYRPRRAETLAALARHLRESGSSAGAVLFAKQAMSLPPSGDTLFIDEAARTTKVDEDLAISAYYVGDIEGGMAACQRLTRARERGPEFQEFILKTAQWYAPQAVEAKHRGVFHIPEEVLEGGRWAPSTPTIVPWGDGFLVGIRLVNYWQERGRWYESRDPDRHIRTQTAILRCSADLLKQEFLGVQEYTPPPGWRQGWEGGVAIIGLEDERWCVHQGEIWFTATTFDGDPPRGPRVVLGRLRNDGREVSRAMDLHYDRATSVEKNWVPRSRDGRLELIYSYDPYVVLDVDLETGECTEKIRSTPPMAAWAWRGGAFDGKALGRLGLVHERLHHENHNVYFHRFFKEKDGAITESSRPFTFEHHGIEYAAGMVRRSDGGVIVTYSVEDKEARFIVFSEEQIGKLL